MNFNSIFSGWFCTCSHFYYFILKTAGSYNNSCFLLIFLQEKLRFAQYILYNNFICFSLLCFLSLSAFVEYAMRNPLQYSSSA